MHGNAAIFEPSQEQVRMRRGPYRGTSSDEHDQPTLLLGEQDRLRHFHLPYFRHDDDNC